MGGVLKRATETGPTIAVLAAYSIREILMYNGSTLANIPKLELDRGYFI